MNIQYRFQLIFLKLVLKRALISESSLTINLIEPVRQQTPYFQSQDIFIKRNESVVKLDSLSSFKFTSSVESGEHALFKYTIKGKSENLVRNVPLNIKKMIAQFENTNQSEFEETFSGQSAQIFYRCSILKYQTEPLGVLVLPPPGEVQSPEGRKRVGSLSKSRRPPTLTLSKKILSPKAEKHVLPSPISGHQINNYSFPSPSSGNLSGNFLKLATSDFDDTQSVSVLSGGINQIKADPLKQIQKVKELISSHHRPEQHHASNHHLSYKLKIVFAMLIYGILFLLYDTISDRKSRSIKSMHKKHGHVHKAGAKHDRRAESQQIKKQGKPKKNRKNKK